MRRGKRRRAALGDRRGRDASVAGLRGSLEREAGRGDPPDGEFCGRRAVRGALRADHLRRPQPARARLPRGRDAASAGGHASRPRPEDASRVLGAHPAARPLGLRARPRALRHDLADDAGARAPGHSQLARQGWRDGRSGDRRRWRGRPRRRRMRRDARRDRQGPGRARLVRRLPRHRPGGRHALGRPAAARGASRLRRRRCRLDRAACRAGARRRSRDDRRARRRRCDGQALAPLQRQGRAAVHMGGAARGGCHGGAARRDAARHGYRPRRLLGLLHRHPDARRSRHRPARLLGHGGEPADARHDRFELVGRGASLDACARGMGRDPLSRRRHRRRGLDAGAGVPRPGRLALRHLCGPPEEREWRRQRALRGAARRRGAEGEGRDPAADRHLPCLRQLRAAGLGPQQPRARARMGRDHAHARREPGARPVALQLPQRRQRRVDGQHGAADSTSA